MRTKHSLKLAYTTTIKNTQGMSFNNVVVNSQNCYQSGMPGVAIGWVNSIEELQVVNFLEKNI